MKQKTNIILSAILVIAWMIVIFCFSAMPADESNSESMNIVNKVVEKFEGKTSIVIRENGEQAIQINEINNKDSLQNTTKNDITTNQNESIKTNKATLLKLNKLLRKFAHASVYFILYILVLNLIYQIKGKYKFAYCMISIAVCFVYACTDEFHQLFVDGRTGLFSDVIIDTIGAIISFVIVEIIYRITTIIHRKNKNNIKSK